MTVRLHSRVHAFVCDQVRTLAKQIITVVAVARFHSRMSFCVCHVRRLANRLNDLTQWLSYIHICVLLCFWPQLLQGNRVNYDFNANTDVTIASLGL